ncbi:hypothetical protein [Candidatus Nitrospira nitrificans]|jgi:hypothetical protein|uniref:Uncharacterized protein n=1 Tax=Candidatus Nitrospira nitrificans TaxID=1742973 RepID=A0A0S4LDL7_9BACT|nr:hypothetical protein [Candidatus Nitrospira nitrificans]CUS34733.1 conserved hypothetical protein [Candidatus Nitrospira nitrificans]
MATLTEFLRKQKAADNPRLRLRRQREWVSALEGLFETIRCWLAEAEREKLIKVRTEKVPHTEESLGTFDVPRLTMTVDHKTIVMKPIGATVIGADGRVDMVSPKGTYILLYLADRGKWVHGFGSKPSEFPGLSEKVFTDLLTRALA